MTSMKQFERLLPKVFLIIGTVLGLIFSMQPAAYAASPILFKGGDDALWAKEKLDEPWIRIDRNGVDSFNVSGNRILITRGSEQWMKDGVTGTWYQVASSGVPTISF